MAQSEYSKLMIMFDEIQNMPTDQAFATMQEYCKKNKSTAISDILKEVHSLSPLDSSQTQPPQYYYVLSYGLSLFGEIGFKEASNLLVASESDSNPSFLIGSMVVMICLRDNLISEQKAAQIITALIVADKPNKENLVKLLIKISPKSAHKLRKVSSIPNHLKELLQSIQ